MEQPIDLKKLKMKTQNIITACVAWLIIVCISCNKQQMKKDPMEFKYEIINIEGCEYFKYMGAQGYKHITHKGNCKNLIHYNKPTE